MLLSDYPACAACSGEVLGAAHSVRPSRSHVVTCPRKLLFIIPCEDTRAPTVSGQSRASVVLGPLEFFRHRFCEVEMLTASWFCC
jgi:hypothetical protein